MFDYHAAWVIVGLLIALPLINLLLRRRKTAPTPVRSSSDEEVRPAYIPKTYSWDDWIKDIYSAGVSTDLIMEKIRWCGMPKRPKPETITTTTVTPTTIVIGDSLQGGAAGVSSGIGIGIGGTYTPTPNWIGGVVIPSSTIDPNPPYYNASNVSCYSGSYYNNAMTNLYPYGSSYYNTSPNVYNYTSSAICTNSAVNVTSSNMASFTHARFTG